jgi:hypothetical protein
MIALLIGSLIGCVGRGPQTTSKGRGGEKLTLSVPKTPVSITQGDETKVSVNVVREKFEGPIQLKFDLPEGITLAEDNPRIDKDKKDEVFTLRADKNTKPQDKASVNVTATHEDPDLKTTSTFHLTIQESVESKRAKKTEFEATMKARLEQAKMKLTMAETNALKIENAGKKADVLKDLASVSQDLQKTQEKFKELQSAAVEEWQQVGQQVEARIESLERSADRAVGLVEQNLKKKE